MFELLKLKFDGTFRKKRFAQKVLNGIRNALIDASINLDNYIEHEELLLTSEKYDWLIRQRKSEANCEKIKTWGYETPEDLLDEYYSSLDDEIDHKLVELAKETSYFGSEEVSSRYTETVNEFTEEIEAAKKTREMVEKISPILFGARVSKLDDIEQLFHDHDCAMLLHMPSVIDLPRIIAKEYKILK